MVPMVQKSNKAPGPTRSIVLTFVLPPKIIKNIVNRFWRDVTKACMHLNTTTKYKHAFQIQMMPLWFNSRIKLEHKKTGMRKVTSRR